MVVIKTLVNLQLCVSSLIEDADRLLGRAVLLGVQLAHLVVRDTEASQNLSNISLALRVQLRRLAHDESTLKVPLIKNIAAVVNNQGVLTQVHHVPVLVVG